MARIVITGSNRGIGLELARQYADAGHSVLAACRSASPELRDLDVTIIEDVDVTTEDGIAALSEGVGDEPVDVLINNAGYLKRVTLEDLDLDLIRKQLEVNSLGPLRCTAALLERLTEGAKVAIITSRMGSIADNTSGGHYGYRMSKAAVNMAGRSLAHDLRPRGVSVTILHPGWVETDMGGSNALVDTETSARGIMDRIEALSPETSGVFWHAVKGERLPW